MELLGFNAIIAASVLNPTVLRETWLSRHGFIKEGELLAGCAFTDQVVHVVTPRYIMTILPQQIQFAPTDRVLARELVPEFLGDLVDRIPHTPFHAIGLNFVWAMTPRAGESVASMSRRLFFDSRSPIAAEFDVADGRWGAYMSKDVGEGRLKLDIKPAIRSDTQTEAIHAIFNFHRDVSGESAPTQLRATLSRWAAFEGISEGIVEKLK